jgi:hypothetical protein
MSFGVIVNERTAPPAQGAPTDTGTWFVTGKVGTGPTDAPVDTHSIQDFEAAFGPRATGNQDLYDAVDVAFREGVNHVVVGAQASTGDYGDGLALLDDWRLGPGQVSVISAPPSADLANDVIAFCANNNRVGLLDVNVDDDYSDIETSAGFVPENSDSVTTFAPWVSVPGAAGTIGAGPRQVPASAVIAGLCNRADMLGNPNRAAAGRDFPLQYVTDFVMDPPNDVDRAGLFAVGVNAFADDFGVLENYGFQTNIAPTEETPFWQFNCARARMWLKAQAKAIGGQYMFKSIDAEGRLANALKTDIDAICLALYNANGLFGATPADAFQTTVTTTIDETAMGTLHVVLEARYSLHTRAVIIDLVSIPITGAL